MDQTTLLGLQKVGKTQSKRSQGADLQHATARNAITEVPSGRKLADNVQHGRVPLRQSSQGGNSEQIWAEILVSSGILAIDKQEQPMS
jgi:hypothetical protein